MAVFSKTDVGKKRTVNQDAFFTGEFDNGATFAVVCDGMGGAAAGNVASERAASMIFNYVVRSYSPKMNSVSIEKMLRAAVETANDEIWELASRKEDYFGMGTTAVAVLVADNLIHVVHVGDSRAYLIDADSIEKLTTDHSIVQDLLSKGEITEAEAKTHPKRNIITRAVGADKTVVCDYNITLKTESSSVLICTDGLSNLLSEEELIGTVHSLPPEECVESLINQANEKGGPDNITAVLIY